MSRNKLKSAHFTLSWARSLRPALTWRSSEKFTRRAIFFRDHLRHRRDWSKHESTCFHAAILEIDGLEFTWFPNEGAGRRNPSEESEALSENALQDYQGAPNWFAVYTSPRHEKRVEQQMSLRGIEHFLPLYQVRRKWSDGSKVTLDLPLFPGYLFAYIERTERVRVLEVPGVLTIVGGTARAMAPLPRAEVDALRTGLSLRHAEPHPLLTVGQKVRIRSGALAGMAGVVDRKKNGLRVVLTMDLILQSIAVEVDAEEVEPVESGVLCSAAGCAS